MFPGTPYEEALPDDGCRLVSIDNDDKIQWVKRHSGKIGAVTGNGTQVRAFVGDARQLEFGALSVPGQGTKHAFWVDLDADGQETSIHLIGTGTGDLNVNSVLEVPGTGWMMSVEIDGTASIPLAGGGTAELRGGYTPHLVLLSAALDVTSVASPVLASTGGALLLRRFINGSVHATGLTLRGTGYVDGPFVSPPATGGTGVYYVRFSPQGAMEEVREFSGGPENRRVRDVKILDDGTIVVSGKYETGAQCECCTPRQELLLEKIPDITVMEGGFLSAWTPAGALQWELRHHAVPKDEVETTCQ